MSRSAYLACGLLLVTAAPLLAAPLRILPLGDSITHGVTSRGADGGYSYRYWLWQRLVDAGVEVDFVGSQNTPYDSPLAYPSYQGQAFDPDHEGHFGWSSRMIDESLPTWLAAYDADVALVHLGHNDHWREIAPGNGTYADTENHLTNIIQSLRADNPNILVLLAQVVASNPDQPPEGPYFPTAHINMLNTLVPTIAAATTTAASPVIVVDQHTGFDPLTMIYDGVHTNALGEQRMADIWWQAIVAATTLAGDYNADGAVDAADYIVWRDTLGAAGPGLAADGNRDQIVDSADYDLWRARFGTIAGSASATGATSAVPEPATLMLLVLAATGWQVRWRRIKPISCSRLDLHDKMSVSLRR
jgi:lysophospholipase L1-like esterase